MFEPASLAATASAAIAPFIPALTTGLTNVVTGAQEKLGSDLWTGLKRLWTKIWPNDDDEALGEIRDDPSSPDSELILRLRLKKLLRDDESLAREVSTWLDGAATIHNDVVIASGERSVAIGTMRAGTVMTGNIKPTKPQRE